jgi:hypothetical protein
VFMLARYSNRRAMRVGPHLQPHRPNGSCDDLQILQ